MSEYESSSSERVRHAAETIRRIREEIGKAVVGQRVMIDQVLVALISGGHVLLEGVPGLGKTLTVLALSRTFQGKFARVQFTPDLMPSDLTGHAVYDMQSGEFHVRRGPIFTHLLLADEINRAPAKTQAALLEVMQERQVSIEGESHTLEPPFMVLATQNPIELEGTYPLPEAQLDRFLLKVMIDYPSEEEEQALVGTVTRSTVGSDLHVDDVGAVVETGQVRELQQAAAEIIVDEQVVDYAVRLVRTTRRWGGVASGAGPRGAIALVRCCRAAALLAGRDYVLPDDVKKMTLPALRHRVILTPDMEIDGRSADDVLREILDEVEAPKSEA